ncbi:Por secretion system C-terminal sorting domain-containing protein [Candidatus Kryptobacter tengchongensis]|nr:Por secretion system C-terminal sorting domain-containing protein [Candidatus Kryptobacter tengchongensis]
MFARKAFVFEKVTSVSQESNIPSNFYIHQNYPNPFNSSTAIIYEIPKDGFVRINIYNSLGQRLFSIVNSIQKAGKHITSFDAGNLPSGVYYYQLEVDNFKSPFRKMVLIK